MTNPDLESIRKRLEAVTAPHGRAHARDVMKRHAPADIAFLLAEVVRLRAESLQRLDDLGECENEIARLTSALATAKDEERAAIVAETRYRAAEWGSVGVKDDARVLREHADVIESNRHRGKP